MLTSTNLNPLLLKKKCNNQTKTVFNRNDIKEITSSVKLLGVHIDEQLNFNVHISNVCKSAFK